MSLAKILSGTKVVAMIPAEEENEYHFIEGKVTSIHIDDYYFEEKDEPIYISVSFSPDGEIPDHIDPMDLAQVPLDRIRKA